MYTYIYIYICNICINTYIYIYIYIYEFIDLSVFCGLPRAGIAVMSPPLLRQQDDRVPTRSLIIASAHMVTNSRFAVQEGAGRYQPSEGQNGLAYKYVYVYIYIYIHIRTVRRNMCIYT